jgi:hypothetical protein
MTPRPLKSVLKDFFSVWKPSLARRLSLSFTVFGLVIGYAVFIYLAISSTNALIKLASDSVGEYLDYMSREDVSERQDDLLQLIDERMTNIVDAAKIIHVIFPELKFDLYFNDGGAWQHTYMNEQKTVKSESVTDQVFSR